MNDELQVMAPNAPAQPLAVMESAPATPADLVLFAMKNGGTIDQLREFMALQREWESDQARKAYVADMAEFKKNPPTILKDKAVGYKDRNDNFVGYKHATLGNVTNAIVESLAAHGFSHSWDFKQDGGIVHVTCKITHRMGHSESVSMHAGKDDSGKKNAIQQVSSTNSYLQRYTLLAATGLATHDQVDDDGASAEPKDDAPDAEQWAAKAKAAPTMPELNAVYAAGEPKFYTANDQAGLEAFKAACNERKAEIVAARGIDPTKSSRLKDIVGQRSAEAAQ